MQVQINNAVLELVQGNIVEQDVDAIVNAANTSLLGGGGVDGAIHRAAGPELLEECRMLRGAKTGEAKITRGYRLKARHVIHAVGPVYHTGRVGEPEQLANAYRNSLLRASEAGLNSIAFPAISTGAYRYPLHEAAEVSLRTVVDYMREHPEIELVRFVLWDQPTLIAYERALQELVGQGQIS
jgi:O-acetyl-ADP-ribose deacetylase (regulator of RNase III)